MFPKKYWDYYPKVTIKHLNWLIATGQATEINWKNEKRILRFKYQLRRIGTSYGYYGVNGILLRNDKTGKLYAIPSRSSSLFAFLSC